MIRVNNKIVEQFKFPGGECNIRLTGITIGQSVKVTAHLYSSDDVMDLLLTVNAIRVKNPDVLIDLIIPYFPYARQDRVCSEGEAFSAAVMAKLVNGLDCQKVRVFDPHSDVTVKLLEHCEVVSQADILHGSVVENLVKDRQLVVVAPDAGATKKTKAVVETFAQGDIKIESRFCSKVRDPKTGMITKTVAPDDIGHKELLLIDDICDGGRTFIELAKVLKDNGAADLYLYVTHGIFSKSLDVLRPHFKHVFCWHTFLKPEQQDSQFLTIMESNHVY